MFNLKDSLSLDDVLLEPKYSEIISRSNVDVSVSLGNMKFKHPIIPANMKTIMSPDMAFAIAKSGGLAILHRFDLLTERLDLAKSLIDKFGSQYCAVSIGVQKFDYDNIDKFINVGVKSFCIDIAHGDSKLAIDMIKHLKTNYHDLFVIAGNTCTEGGAYRLWSNGADVVKVGVGSGSLCTTRIETGNGVAQLTALIETQKAQRELKLDNPENNYYFISDGGHKNSGDCIKSLCFSDMVMVGNIFAGCEESPGNIINIDGNTYKEYVGSSTHKTNHIEGVAAIVRTKGSYNSILTKLLEGLRSGCAYQGVNNLIELKKDPQFLKISSAGLRESHPHDLDKIVK